MKTVDVNTQVAEQTSNSTADGQLSASYETPRVIQLGKSSDIIRGYWRTGTYDYSTDFYITGE
jgi:hypothetical protein